MKGALQTQTVLKKHTNTQTLERTQNGCKHEKRKHAGLHIFRTFSVFTLRSFLIMFHSISTNFLTQNKAAANPAKDWMSILVATQDVTSRQRMAFTKVSSK